MRKFLACLIKEYLLLIRDKTGLILLFVMPLALVLLITLIQDNTFKTIKESSISLSVLNDDNDSLGNSIMSGLNRSGIFNIVHFQPNGSNTEESLQKLKMNVAEGKSQIGLYIPKYSTEVLKRQISVQIKNSIKGKQSKSNSFIQTENRIKIALFLDPAAKLSFKQTVVSTIQSYAVSIENKLIYNIFTDEIGKILPFSLPKFEESSFDELLKIEEHYPSLNTNEILPNSTQHNVPAWTLFAIFFIVIPLSGNMIRERDEGSGLRLKTMPFPHFIVLSGKIAIYLSVCLLQFSMLFLAGKFILPLFGLPALQINVDFVALFIIVVSSGLAAAGYSVLIGTLAGTQEQAAIFGSVSVMMFAAIGGIWVPTYIMPPIMRKLCIISPLNWGLEGFYDVFLRSGSVKTIVMLSVLLIAFSILTISISYIYNRIKRQ